MIFRACYDCLEYFFSAYLYVIVYPLKRLIAIITSWNNDAACDDGGGRSTFQASVTVSAVRVLIAVCRR